MDTYMKKVLIILITTFIVVYAKEEIDNTQNTSKQIALNFCQAYANANFNDMIYYSEKHLKDRLRKEIKKLKDTPEEYYEFLNNILVANIECKIKSIMIRPDGSKTYYFNSSAFPEVSVDKVDGVFVVVDRYYLKKKREKIRIRLMEKSKKIYKKLLDESKIEYELK